MNSVFSIFCSSCSLSYIMCFLYLTIEVTNCKQKTVKTKSSPQTVYMETWGAPLSLNSSYINQSIIDRRRPLVATRSPTFESRKILVSKIVQIYSISWSCLFPKRYFSLLLIFSASNPDPLFFELGEVGLTWSSYSELSSISVSWASSSKGRGATTESSSDGF